jgi:hypothetical protein
MRPAIGCLAALSLREQVEAFHAFSDTEADRGCSRLKPALTRCTSGSCSWRGACCDTMELHLDECRFPQPWLDRHFIRHCGKKRCPFHLRPPSLLQDACLSLLVLSRACFTFGCRPGASMCNQRACFPQGELATPGTHGFLHKIARSRVGCQRGCPEGMVN